MSYAAFKRALDFFDGNQSKMATAIGTSQQRISYINKHQNAAPAELVLAVERETGVPRHELRPDLYPAEEAAA